MELKAGQKSCCFNQTFQQTQKKRNRFKLQYHNRIQRVELERSTCTIQKVIQSNDQDLKSQILNEAFVQPKLYYQQNDPTMIFETQIQFPNGFTQVWMNEIKIAFNIRNCQSHQESKNKYQIQNFDLNSISVVEKEQIFLNLEDFYLDVRIDCKKYKSNVSFRHAQDEPVIDSKATFISTDQRESLTIKNIIKSYKKMFTSILTIIFYEDLRFDKKVFNIISQVGNKRKKDFRSSSSDYSLQTSNLSCFSSDSNSLKNSDYEFRQISAENDKDYKNKSSPQKLKGFQNEDLEIHESNESFQEQINSASEIQSDLDTKEEEIFNILNGIVLKNFTIKNEDGSDQNLLSFQNSQNSFIEKQDKDSKQKKINQLYTLSKKNVVKNIVKAFQRYLKSEEFQSEIEAILLKHNSISYESFLKKYLNYEKKKSYNNNLIKLLISNEEYSNVFKFFITKRSKQMLQNSNVSDKNIHFQIIDKYIQAIEDPFTDDGILSSKKGSKKKRKSKKN